MSSDSNPFSSQPDEYVRATDFLGLRNKTEQTSDVAVVTSAATLLTGETKETVKLASVLGDEGIEMMCRAVNDALNSVKFRLIVKKEASETPAERGNKKEAELDLDDQEESKVSY